MRRQCRGAGHVIGDPVARLLIGADIDSHQSGSTASRREAAAHDVEPFAVEAEAVDDGAVGAETEHARAWVATLRLRHDAADLNEAEAQAEQRVGHLRALVESCRQSDRVGEPTAEGINREPRIVPGPACGVAEVPVHAR